MAALYEFDRRTAVFLALCCQLTILQYENDGRFDVPEGYNLVAGFKAVTDTNPEWFGFVIESNSDIIIAFRGSKTLFDWQTDTDMSQVKCSFCPGKTKIHIGFNDMYTSCRPELHNILQHLNHQKQLYITGHSLGGALALLNTVDTASNSLFKNPILYNFGSPRVGNPNFVSQYNSLIKQSMRIVNEYDLVPHMPSIKISSNKPKQYLYYDHVKTEIKFAMQTRSAENNHSIDTYINALSHMRDKERKPF